jgi:dipeptidyl aminopeptidase/acylaminoacyl peptidase
MSEDIQLDGAVFSPPGEGPHPALVVCHGMPAAPQGKEADANVPDTAPSYSDIAKQCAAEGFVTCVFNFRGTGNSSGNFDPFGWTVDLASVLSFLETSPEVDPKRIYCLGSSLGGAVVIYTAAHHPAVAAIVSFASPATMMERIDPEESIAQFRDLGIIRDNDFPPNTSLWAQSNEKISPIKWVGDIAPKPLLLLHGDADDVVDPEDLETLFALANEPKEKRLLPGVGHRFRYEKTVQTLALDWLKTLAHTE